MHELERVRIELEWGLRNEDHYMLYKVCVYMYVIHTICIWELVCHYVMLWCYFVLWLFFQSKGYFLLKVCQNQNKMFRSRVGSRKVGICPAVGLKNLSSVYVRVRSSVIGAGCRLPVTVIEIDACARYRLNVTDHYPPARRACDQCCGTGHRCWPSVPVIGDRHR